MTLAQITIQQAIAKIIQGESLLRAETATVMATIMDGQATSAQIASFVTALRMKGESIEEIIGFAQTMRSKATRLQTVQNHLVDTCGTGGDGSHTFNISTATAIVAAAGGVRIAKHGNRAISSKSGSADVLEALGVELQLNPEQAERCLEQVGICFMFAPLYHESMKHAAGPRKEIGIRTIFNMLGPLTNPAGADRQLIGVYDQKLTPVFAEVLQNLGLKRALIVASDDGLDEISVSAPTQISELRDGIIKTERFDPTSVGISLSSLKQIDGGDAAYNAQLIRRIFAGEKGPNRDIVLINTAACFYLAEYCTSIAEGVQLAADTIDKGLALAKLNELVEATKQLSNGCTK